MTSASARAPTCQLAHRGPQIEMTYLASRRGARFVERPIVFADRTVGVSKMSRRIIVEALLVVLRLRWQQFRGRIPGPPAGRPLEHARRHCS